MPIGCSRHHLAFPGTMSVEQETFELVVGGDTYKGVYVPPLMAEVMKEMQAEAMVKVRVGERLTQTAADGNGPVSALDAAVRRALRESFPELDRVHLRDYKVRIIDEHKGYFEDNSGQKLTIDSFGLRDDKPARDVRREDVRSGEKGSDGERRPREMAHGLSSFKAPGGARRLDAPGRDGVDPAAGRGVRALHRRGPRPVAHVPAGLAGGRRGGRRGDGGPDVRIALACAYAWDAPGGVQVHVRQLARRLQERGHRVVVVAPARRAPGEPHVVGVGRPVKVPFNGSVAQIAPASSRAVRRALDDFAPQVIHAHEPLVPSAAMHAVRWGGSPAVATFHAYADRSPLFSAVAPALRRHWDRLAVRIAVSEAARAFVVERFPRGEVRVIPNGVEVEQFGGAAPAGLPEGRRVLFVNRNSTTHIVGLTERENEALLSFLFEHVRSPAFQCRFRWRPGSVAFWDNRCVQHYAVPDYAERRLMHRVTIGGPSIA